MGAKAWLALVLGVAGGAVAATVYWMSHPIPTPPAQCIAPDVDPVAGTGVCPPGYEPDPLQPGCCAPIQTGQVTMGVV